MKDAITRTSMEWCAVGERLAEDGARWRTSRTTDRYGSPIRNLVRYVYARLLLYGHARSADSCKEGMAAGGWCISKTGSLSRSTQRKTRCRYNALPHAFVIAIQALIPALTADVSLDLSVCSLLH